MLLQSCGISELEGIYRRCLKRTGHSKQGLASVWAYLKSWKLADELEADMLILERNVRACEMRFLTSAVVRYEQSVNVLTNVLYAMNEEQRTAFDRIGHSLCHDMPQVLEELLHEVVLRQSSADFIAGQRLAKPALMTVSDLQYLSEKQMYRFRCRVSPIYSKSPSFYGVT
ncbi:hypothetical protein BKA93DRAFT_91541 [Sparassis latifolia]